MRDISTSPAYMLFVSLVLWRWWCRHIRWLPPPSNHPRPSNGSQASNRVLRSKSKHQSLGAVEWKARRTGLEPGTTGLEPGHRQIADSSTLSGRDTRTDTYTAIWFLVNPPASLRLLRCPPNCHQYPCPHLASVITWTSPLQRWTKTTSMSW